MDPALPPAPDRPVVLVTGSSRGIGLATVVAFARTGAHVVATMRNLDGAGPLRSALAAEGLDAEVVRLDVVDDASVAEAVGGTLARHGRVDVVVNNAGGAFEGTTEQLSIEDFRFALDVDFLGAVRVIKAVLPSMRERGSGCIVNVSSTAGAMGNPFQDAYSAAKFALEGLTECLAPVMAPFGVHVCVVEPGTVANDILDRVHRPFDPTVGPYADQFARFDALRAGAFAASPPPSAIADVIVAVANDPEPKLRYQTSEDVTRMVGVKYKDVSGERVMRLLRGWIEPKIEPKEAAK